MWWRQATTTRANLQAMMDRAAVVEHADRFLAAWNSQEIERVIACYSPDLVYRDPNTTSPVNGAQDMRRYLARLFDVWEMEWFLREAHPLAGIEGAAVLWRAELRHRGSGRSFTAEGMDLVLMGDGRIVRNDVYFDRTEIASVLAP